MDPLYYKLGYIYFFQQRYEEALKKFKVSLKYNKSNHDYYFITGCTYYHLHNYLEAIKYLKKAIEINPKMGKAFFVLGLCFTTLGENFKRKEDDNNFLKCKKIGKKAIHKSIEIDKNAPIDAYRYIKIHIDRLKK